MGFSWPIVETFGDYLRLMRDVARTAMRHEFEAEAWATQIKTLKTENADLKARLEKERSENEALRRYTSTLEDRAYAAEDAEYIEDPEPCETCGRP